MNIQNKHNKNFQQIELKIKNYQNEEVSPMNKQKKYHSKEFLKLNIK